MRDIAPMDMMIAVRFGSAFVTKDGQMIYDGERDYQDGVEPKTLADIEAIAAAAPDSDWQIVLQGPLSGATYKRQSDGLWQMIESNYGFA